MESADRLKQALTIFLLLLLPWIILIAGLLVSFISVWFFLGIVLWIGIGIIFYSALVQT